jgi:Flp pilus assembly protein TadB
MGFFTTSDPTERGHQMAGILWAVVILLLALWVLAKLVFGIAGALFHLLLVAAVVVVVYNVIKAGAARRT